MSKRCQFIFEWSLNKRICNLDLHNFLWQTLHSIPSSSSSSFVTISQFGFVPPSGQPDLQSRAGSWVWGSAEKAAHEGQVLSGLPHECHGPGAGKGSCGQNLGEKAQNPPQGWIWYIHPCPTLWSSRTCVLHSFKKGHAPQRHFNKIEYFQIKVDFGLKWKIIQGTLLHSDVNPTGLALWIFCLIHIFVTWTCPYQ